MTLVDDWKTIITTAWSVRFALLSSLLTGCDFAMPYLMPDHPTHVLAVFGGCFAAASAAARVILQLRMRKPDA